MKHRTLALLAVLALNSGPILAQTASPATPASPAATTVKAATVRNLGPAEFDKLRGATNTVILDVRTPAEYADGHLPGAKLLDFRSPGFAQQVAQLDKSRTYLVHCAGGVRSAKACTKMIDLGFTNVVNLDGGLSAWQDAGKPLEK